MTLSTPSSATGLVLDIDDTLCDTARTMMQLMAKELGTAAPFDTDTYLQKYDQPFFVPDWKNEAGEKWLADHLLNAEFLGSLPPIKHAIEGLHRIHEIVPVSLYLTSRDERNQAVTEAWLTAAGVPPAPVVTRPQSITDWSWKLKYLAENYPETLALIDNEVHIPDPNPYKGVAVEIQPFAENRQDHPEVINIHTWADLETWLKQHVASVKL